MRREESATAGRPPGPVRRRTSVGSRDLGPTHCLRVPSTSISIFSQGSEAFLENLNNPGETDPVFEKKDG